MRLNFYEANRIKLIEGVFMERQKVMQEEAAGEWFNLRIMEDPDYFINSNDGLP